MRLFLDANVVSAAAHWPQGRSRALFRLADAGRCEIVSSRHAIGEARRNLALKSPKGAEVLDSLLKGLERVGEAGPNLVKWAAAFELGENDAPILAAAAAAEADILVTCDRRHFGHLFGSEIGGVRVAPPAEALHLIVDHPAG